MKKPHLTLLAALLIGVVPLSASAAGGTPSDPLMPTGDSTLDTANLQAALHDSRLDSGGTLYLGPGTFMIHRFIGRQNISDSSDPSYSNILFNGTIQGAGKGVTILKGRRGPNGEGFEPLHYDFPGFAADDHTLLGLVQVYLGVKDLTFDSEATLVDPCNAYGNRGLVTYVGTGSFEYALNELIGTDITNVHFKGSLDSNGDPETPHLFQQYGDEGGVHNITSSEFENSSNGALQFFDLANATINVGGKPKDKVTVANALSGAVQVVRCADCTVNVSRIETHDAPGLFFSTHSQNTHSLVTMTHNTIILRPQSDYAGAEIWGRYDDADIVLSHNRFHSEDSFIWGPIFIEGVKHGTITNNTFTGSGSAAIYLGVYQSPGSFGLVGNNLQNWENTGLNPWWMIAAPIWLGSYITDSVVIGGNNSVNVFDEPGYDEFGNPLPPDANGNAQTYDEDGSIIPKNNVFTGVNNMHSNIGQDVREVMKQKVEAKLAMMSELSR